MKKQASLLHAAMDDWACALFVPPPAALSSHKVHKGIFLLTGHRSFNFHRSRIFKHGHHFGMRAAVCRVMLKMEREYLSITLRAHCGWPKHSVTPQGNTKAIFTLSINNPFESTKLIH